ncbi:STAS domain-containing protein [Microbispora triticiradicis]|uniref:STAS domain-containing protein n=2 Tax=Microbispora triticiradicis TaxID=2200763 RepID=A0ABX9LS23_9ACTN|nr:STAS domain-containing protein [Microbispora triticiradicis]
MRGERWMDHRRAQPVHFVTSAADQCGVLYTDTYLSVRWSPADASVIIDGEVDVSNSEALASALARARKASGEIVIDTGDLRFIDLAGLRALLAPASFVTHDAVRLRNVPPYLGRLLRMLDY